MSRPEAELPGAPETPVARQTVRTRLAPAPARPAGPEAAGTTAGAELTSLLGPVRAGNAFEETVERLLTVIKLGVVAARRPVPGRAGTGRPAGGQPHHAA